MYSVTLRRVRVNDCCCGTAISITHSECMSVASVIHHKNRMHCIVICGQSGCTIFCHITLRWHDFCKKVIEYKMCLEFLHNFCLNHFPF
jgi:hypothetical protein